MSSRIRCHVIEVPTDDDWLSRRGSQPRELLPWADPYIAGLMRKLQRRSAAVDEQDSSDPFQGEDAEASVAVYDDGWPEDALLPRSLRSARVSSYPAVLGGLR